MNKRQAQFIVDGWWIGEIVDPRKFKRAENIAMPEYDLFKAYCRGSKAHCSGKQVRNPYPPGKRAEQWQRGRDGY